MWSSCFGGIRGRELGHSQMGPQGQLPETQSGLLPFSLGIHHALGNPCLSPSQLSYAHQALEGPF